MRIDAHHHFWRYSTADYGWIDESMAGIRRDFLPEDLAAEIAGAAVDGVISVHACQTIAESEWLLALASAHPWIRGVVGWVPLADPAVAALLDRLAENTALRGVRHVLQAEPDSFMDRADFNAGLAQLHRRLLTYDILIYHHQLPTAIHLVDRHPNQTFVLDHIAKPDIRTGVMQPWARDLAELARRPHVFCKLSGVVTEADHASWSYEQILPYMETALAAFGPERMMFGSDWPVCRVATVYADWVRTVDRFAASLSATEKRALFAETAIRAYRLNST
ncbi:MAG TPA: amidohydrolase family protein [Acidobacteriaceae bacterium]|jgi:L-fuconolactonase|nr:amidohydrolase family protein [Acidobacteriaceae bacterium]